VIHVRARAPAFVYGERFEIRGRTMPKGPNEPGHAPANAAGIGSAGGAENLKLSQLAAALAEETRTSESLRQHLETLRRKVDEIADGFERRLADAVARGAALDTRLYDQDAPRSSQDAVRGDSARALDDARAELARVAAERDRLLKRLAQIEGMQTTTLGLPAGEPLEPIGRAQPLPSIEELMASLSTFEEGGRHAAPGHLHLRTEGVDEDSPEMLSPEIVFPEEFGEPPPVQPAAKPAPVSRLLVLIDAEPPIKYPLYKDVMTIGRAESADIQINGDYVSRIHARLISTAVGTIIEDVDSKNGISVNSKATGRYALQHGDVVDLGRLRFTYIETPARR
jgi:hypothetical protein